MRILPVVGSLLYATPFGANSFTASLPKKKGTSRLGGTGTLLWMASPKKKTLGLITFDLDDSLYPIEPVMDQADAAFCRAMNRLGFRDDSILPNGIAETCRQIRHELPPDESVALTHTEVRRRAIRREMEGATYRRKLQETADDWATPVSDLSPIVRSFAKKCVPAHGNVPVE
jgi:hypothetical protein